MSYQELIASAKLGLLRARQPINAKISADPMPISGRCAQFDNLLSERPRIAADLTELVYEVFIPTPRALTTNAGIQSR